MHSNILPRYSDKSVTDFTTTSFIQSHQPELLSTTGREAKAIEGGREVLQIEGQRPSQPPAPVPQPSALYSPNVLLSGHTDEVLACCFSPTGDWLATGGMDKTVMLWDLRNKCQNTGVAREFKNAVTDLKFTSDSGDIIVASADRTVSLIDSETLAKSRKFVGHESYVNSVDSFKRGVEYVLSGSNDRTIRLWDRRQKAAAKTFRDEFQVLAVCTGTDHFTFYSGGLDNAIRIWDVRREAPTGVLQGHSDSVTSLSVSHEGSFLLSNAMDSSLRVWDLRPFSATRGPLKVYKGHLHGYEKGLLRSAWNFNGRLVASGSSDKNVYLWDSNTRQVLLTLGGHAAVVNAVAFSPARDLIASASSDRNVILTELPRLY